MTAGVKPIPPKRSAGPELTVPLDSLKALLLSGPVFNFLDLQAALGMDRGSAKRAIRLLVACVLLETQGRPGTAVTSLRYTFSQYALRLLWNQTGSPIPQRHIREVLDNFLGRVASTNRSASACRILSVSLPSNALDPEVPSLEFIETEIQVAVDPRSCAGLELKHLVKSLLSVGDRALQVSLILQTASG